MLTFRDIGCFVATFSVASAIAQNGAKRTRTPLAELFRAADVVALADIETTGSRVRATFVDRYKGVVTGRVHYLSIPTEREVAPQASLRSGRYVVFLKQVGRSATRRFELEIGGFGLVSTNGSPGNEWIVLHRRFANRKAFFVTDNDLISVDLETRFSKSALLRMALTDFIQYARLK